MPQMSKEKRKRKDKHPKAKNKYDAEGEQVNSRCMKCGKLLPEVEMARKVPEPCDDCIWEHY